MAGEWTTVEFSELLVNGTRNGVYKTKDLHGSGAKIVNMGELFAYPRLHSIPMKRVELTAADLEKSSLKAGDLLFARRSLVAEGAGKCSIVMEANEPTTFESSIIRARPDRTKADSLFLYYFFASPQGRYLLGTILRQVAVSGITGSDLVRLRIPRPSLKEQQAIACILAALDDKIELNQQMNETLDAIATAIFKDWFIDFGPARAKTENLPPYFAKDTWGLFPNTLDSQDRPDRWGERPLYGIAEFINGAAYKDMDFSRERDGFPVIKIAELKNGVTATTRFTTTDLGSKYRIDTKDILFSWSGNPDTSLDTFIWADGPAWLNQHIFRVRENGTTTRAMIYFQLKQLKPVFAEIARNKQTTGLGHVTSADMKALMVCAPPPAVANAFEEIAGPLFKGIISGLLENRTLEKLRDLLLPKLMSGELRIREAEKILERVS